MDGENINDPTIHLVNGFEYLKKKLVCYAHYRGSVCVVF